MKAHEGSNRSPLLGGATMMCGIIATAALALASDPGNGASGKSVSGAELLAPAGPLNNPLLDAQLRRQRTREPVEARTLEELMFSADLSTVLPSEMITLARFLDGPGYLVMQRGPDLIIERSAGLVWLGNRMNQPVQPGSLATWDEKNLGVLWNTSRESALVRVGDVEGNVIEIRSMGMIAVGNMVFEDGTPWTTPRGSNSCTTVCDGINDGACCQYGSNGYPTCLCVPNGDIKHGDCSAGGQRSTGCSLTQN